MSVPLNMTPEQLREIELAYPNSMNPVFSWLRDMQRRQEAEHAEREKNDAVAKLALELMGDIEGCKLDTDFMAEIATRAYERIQAEGEAEYRRGYSSGFMVGDGGGS